MTKSYQIDLVTFFAAVFVTQMLPGVFSWNARFIYQHTHRTATKPKTQNIRPHPQQNMSLSPPPLPRGPD
jgi:hypothetical protein